MGTWKKTGPAYIDKPVRCDCGHTVGVARPRTYAAPGVVVHAEETTLEPDETGQLAAKTHKRTLCPACAVSQHPEWGSLNIPK